jgi:hypothetical protein
MKVLGSTMARCAWVVDMYQLNPDGRSLLDLFQALAKRYRFAKSPENLLDYNKDKALEFNSGTFLKGKNQDVRVGLTIYNNALAADTISSTDNAEAFLADLAQWAKKEHDLVIEPTAILRKTYVSHLDVSFDAELPLANPKLTFIPSLVGSQAIQIDGKPVEYRMGGITAWGENVGGEGALQPFRLERKWSFPFEKNVYFSTAPLRTQEHIATLQQIEMALK